MGQPFSAQSAIRIAEAFSDRRSESSLVNRNVFVANRRTSLRLEPAMWEALGEICQREGLTVHQLCTEVDRRRQSSTLTAAIRVFIVSYFRAAATEEGHAGTGHGTLFDFACNPSQDRL